MVLAPEQLRACALEILGQHGDARARDVLATGQISVDDNAREWEGTAGRIHGHRVTVGVDSAALAMMESAPGVRDAVCAAVAAAIATRPGEAMTDLHAFWAVQPRNQGAAYRGVVPQDVSREDPEALHAALGTYLRTAGEDTLAVLVRGLNLEIKPARTGHQVTVRIPAAQYRAITADGHQSHALQRAIAALMSGPEQSETKVLLRSL